MFSLFLPNTTKKTDGEGVQKGHKATEGQTRQVPHKARYARVNR